MASGGFVGAYARRGTAVSRLAGGGAVVAWLSPASTLFVQRLDTSGQPLASPSEAGTVAPPTWTTGAKFSVAGTADGGWVLAWASAGQTLQFRRYDASGAPLGNAVPVDPAAFAAVTQVQVLSLADGSFVVAWSAGESDTSERAFARKFSAAGVPQTGRAVVSSTAGQQANVHIAALPDGTFLAAWMQRDGIGAASTIFTRHLDAALNPAGAEQTMQTAYASELSLASLANGTTLLAWGARDTGELRWQLLDSAGAPTIPATSPIVTSAQFDPFSYLIDTVEAVPSASGFTVAVESTLGWNRGLQGRITVIRIDAQGAVASRTELGERTLWVASEITETTCSAQSPGVAAAGGEDGRYVLAYDVCAAQGTQGIIPTVEALAR